MINGMSKHLYISNLGLLAQSEYFCRGLPIELEYTQKLGPPAAPLNPPPGPPWGSKKISGGFRHLVRSNPCHLAQETSQNHIFWTFVPPSVLKWRAVQGCNWSATKKNQRFSTPKKSKHQGAVSESKHYLPWQKAFRILHSIKWPTRSGFLEHAIKIRPQFTLYCPSLCFC